mmetsp:Transcript_30169/g.34762  ORF Transcript_30169/g.34762 Transcript_30169/m.34762 type:complete len:123 (-) Transcript_30169:824-1192(-)
MAVFNIDKTSLGPVGLDEMLVDDIGDVLITNNKAAVPFLKKNMVISVNELSDEDLVNAAKTSMSSNILGKEADFFARVTANAVKSVKMKQSQAEKFIDEGSGSNRDGSATKAEANPKKDRFK